MPNCRGEWCVDPTWKRFSFCKGNKTLTYNKNDKNHHNDFHLVITSSDPPKFELRRLGPAGESFSSRLLYAFQIRREPELNARGKKKSPVSCVSAVSQSQAAGKQF